MNDLWNNNEVQFARLLSEIFAIGLTRRQWESLRESMDLPQERIAELFDRAENVFEAAKPAS